MHTESKRHIVENYYSNIMKLSKSSRVKTTTTDSMNNDTCQICLVSLEAGEPVCKALCCSAVWLHIECFKKALLTTWNGTDTHPRCPFCKQAVTKYLRANHKQATPPTVYPLDIFQFSKDCQHEEDQKDEDFVDHGAPWSSDDDEDWTPDSEDEDSDSSEEATEDEDVKMGEDANMDEEDEKDDGDDNVFVSWGS